MLLPLDAADPTAVLHVSNLSKRYGSFWALRDASFGIRRGEILGLIGPNGSGKTTLFRCVAGVTPATRGEVRQALHVITTPRKRLLFFLPDGVRPWPEQTVDWLLRFTERMYGPPPSSRPSLIEQLLLAPLLGARLGELSKGEHRRAMLAMALLTPQPLLMLDEPFDGLDLRQTREVMSVLRHHAENGRTLFLSIHQLGDAARICDRLVLLSSGHVVGEGSLDQLRCKAGVSDGGLEEVFLALT